MDDALGRIRDNPFYVLGLRPSASRAEIEREGQKLLGMLELKLASAATYPTPVGPGARTADKVRQAMAALRDPERRLAHEVWARLDPRPPPKDDLDDDLGELPPPEPPGEDPRAPWPEALSALGWRAR
ncbi:MULTISPECIES: hypothetical protein [Sorangium]|uniref:Heat shock protein DnaJ, N-terminal n=2 Tax=Sorangium TaxID=39643 RepID=A9F5M3_SORC5|nr:MULTISPECIES: hypothetical protein [Sorangium]MDC0684255.1 hypothetical protein [Sorangium aterium]CAN97818.1 putative heat shock protein DnaJ, N-terminal [Sorangium cellulosum So ce56]